MIWYLVSSLAMALAGAAVFIYYLRKGQFDKHEDVKYQMLHSQGDDNPGDDNAKV